MGASPPRRIDHLQIIIFLTFVVMELCICSGNNNTGACREAEMQALLCFKEEAKVSTDWVYGTDCCTKWGGVVCDNITGHVIELRLSKDVGFIDYPLKGTLSSCLLELKHLHHLDLSGLCEGFNGSHIPSFIGSFVNLQYLDLSYLGFQGPIPNQLGHLSNLRTLRLLNVNLKVDSLDWLSSLSNLQVLDMSWINLSMVHNWQEVINMLPSLRELYLSDCDLPKSSYHPLGHNSSLLEVLDLSWNKFNSVIPRWIFNINCLHFLDLSNGGFLGPFPNGGWNLTSLSILDLSYNKLSGSLPSQLFDLSSLVSLNLSNNQFQDVDALSCGDDTLVTKVDTLDWLFNLSNLEYLDLSSINLSMAHKWQEVINTLPSLREIYLSCCSLSKLSHSPHHNNSLLQVLDLSGNKFNTVIPRWIFNLNSLVFLDLTLCGFQGPFPNDHWNLTSLRSLNIFDNEMNGSLPNQLFSLSYLNSLDLSFNQFQGPLPSGRWNLTSLKTLSLIQNYLNSHIPDSIYHCTSLERLDLSQNKFQGILSKSISNLSSLSDLYLSNNMLTGEVPKEIGKLNKLKKFLFSNNNFYGPLPESIGHLSSLEELSFIDNMLEGIVMEKHFVNLTKLTFLYAPRNRLTLKVSPNWVPPFQLDSVSLSNWILGPQFPTWLQSQHQILDVHMSGAKIEGEIPTWFWNFSSRLDTIDLSHNQLRGAIPNEMGNMKLLESLDLSKNKLSGEIPSSFSSLSALGVLNLSYNNLSGKIPSGTQLQGFNASCYIGNNLCGLPLPKNCSVDDGQISNKHENEGDDDSDEVDWFYVSMAIGFAVGFWVTCGSLFLVRSWRIAYFQFLDNKFNSILVWARVSYNHMFNVSF
nr:receptor-like protein 12 [Ipomoea batatas]